MSNHSYANALGNSFLMESRWLQRMLYRGRHVRNQISEEIVADIKQSLRHLCHKIIG